MLLKVYKLGTNPVFALRYFESNANDETYNFNEMNDLQLTRDYIKEHKKIMSLSVDDDDRFFYLNDIYQQYAIIDNVDAENVKRNNRHSHIMLLFPDNHFPDNNYFKLTLLTESSTTEIDLTKNEEWIGVLLPVNIKYKISFKNNEVSDQLLLKIVFNSSPRDFGIFNNRVREPYFDFDSFEQNDEKSPDKNDPGDY